MRPLLALLLLLAACTPTPPEPLTDCSPRDEIDVVDLSASGRTLDVTYGHAAGCATHQISICWDGFVATSMPPQVQLVLWHDDGGESCEAYEQGVLSVDLTPIVGEDGGGPLLIFVDGESVLLEADGA